MENLTDALAIFGFAIFGLTLPVLCSYLGGTKGTVFHIGDMVISMVALGLISASFVIG